MTIVLDTNALMMPVECDVRVFDELERLLGSDQYVVPEAVVSELDRLSDGSGQEATAASVGQDLLERCEIRGHDATNADDAVLELAQEFDAYAVTNDGPLKTRLLGADVPVIGLRGQNKLSITRS